LAEADTSKEVAYTKNYPERRNLVTSEQADVTTAGRRHGTGNKVGKRLLIPDNIEDLPQIMSEFNVVIRPDESLKRE
jgi:hypothetical protein